MKFYIFNLSAQIRQLRDEPVTDWDAYLRFLLNGLIDALLTMIAYDAVGVNTLPTQSLSVQLVGTFLGFGLNLLIVHWLYKANGGHSGVDFLKRVIMLRFILSNWASLFSVVAVVTYLSAQTLGQATAIFFACVFVLLGIGLLIAGYVLLKDALKKLALSSRRSGDSSTQLSLFHET